MAAEQGEITLIARWEDGLLCPPYARVIELLGYFLNVSQRALVVMHAPLHATALVTISMSFTSLATSCSSIFPRHLFTCLVAGGPC